MPPGLAVRAEGLTKRYGDVRALAGLDLAVPTGSVLGLLGPNGAGKTTAVRVLATLTAPDAGRAEVAGVDVLRRPHRVRELIGLAGQYAAVDEKLTGRDNLRMFARLARLPRTRAADRADELLARFGLDDAADRVVRGYSGGMRRRLDLAASLLVRPLVLFLDEPTTGLDPRSRNGIWTEIRALAADGVTVLLTSQYLDEVDHLADRIAVVDAGRAVAEGTPAALKDAIGVPHLHLSVYRREDIAPAQSMLARIGQGPVAVDEERRALNVAAPGGGDYRAFLMPGMFVMTAVTSVTAITGAVCQDKAEGIMDRFRSLPMSRLAVPIGHTVADLIGFLPSLAVMVGAGYLIGWRAQNGWAAAIAAFGLILLLRYALSWAGTWLGLLFTDPQAAFRLTPLVFPATMLANTFVPTEGMPAALRVIADYNPVSAATAACRALFGNPGAGVGDALPLQYPITATVLWSALLLAVFVPLSARRYGRR